MPVSLGILLVLSGLGIMGFGLFLFYAWLPVLYAIFGFDIGLLIGSSLSGDLGALAITLGIIGAVIFAAAAYLLEPYRRMLLGLLGGAAVSLSLAYLFSLDQLLGGWLRFVLAILGGSIGAFLVPRVFDVLVVAASALAGATMVTLGMHTILPSVGLLDRAGGPLPTILITLVLAAVGISWQVSNIQNWVRGEPLSGAKASRAQSAKRQR